MTPSDEQLTELQREWRKNVMHHMQSQENKLDSLLSKINDMQQQYVRTSSFEAALKRISGLEGDRQKVVGAMVLLNVIGGFVLYLIGKFWK